VADAPSVMFLRDTLQARGVPDITVGTGVLPIQIGHTMAMVQRALTVIPDLRRRSQDTVGWSPSASVGDVFGLMGRFLSPQARGVLRAFPRCVDPALGLGPPDLCRSLDALARLERFVDLEEVLDLEAIELREVVDVA
jgi:hypothetical protein